MPISRKMKKGKRPKRNWSFLFLTVALIAVAAYFLIENYSAFQNSDSNENAKAKSKSAVNSVCLDPGHGADDIGATYNGLNESDINLQVANALRTLLTKAGYDVFMTRTDSSTNPSNTERAAYCNSKNATILVSIHHNFFDDNSVDYATALYSKDSDRQLASTILGATSSDLGVTNNGISYFEDSVLSKSSMPAALSEAFFMTNSEESSKLQDPVTMRLNAEASAIYSGIQNYFSGKNQPITISPEIIRND